jgi:type II secretory pathway pseudopilin PulG
MKVDGSRTNCGRGEASRAFTLVETVVSLMVLAIMVTSLFAAFYSGLASVQLSRENLRATQIMLQKMENVRLYKWSQLTDSTYFRRTFSDSYYHPLDASNGSPGTVYAGVITVTNVPTGAGGIPADYASKMQAVTVTVYWTNYPSGGNTNVGAIVRNRQMQTYVARYGMQDYNYIFH